MNKCKHKWAIQDNKMVCNHCYKINNDKCKYCHNDGLYTDFKDDEEVSVCFKHLGDYSSC